jgi:hypothetical protein
MTVPTYPSYDNLRAFAEEVIRLGCWQGASVDGGDLQEIAMKHFLLVEVPFDPEKGDIDEIGDAKPGDPYYVFAWSKRATDLSKP